ncbi:MAG: glycosyltransferase family 4 protein [Chloroflexota bacterium]
MAARGHHVTLACAETGPLAGELHDVRLRVLLAKGVKRRFSPLYAHRLAVLCRAENFDLVHAHLFASTVATATALRDASEPLIVTEHTEGVWQSDADRLLLARALRRAHAAIAVSEPIAERMRNGLGVTVERVHCILNAVHAFRHGQRLERERMIGMVGRLAAEKGADTFLRAVAQVAPVVPNVRFVVVGYGSASPELQLLARRLRIGNRVDFLGSMTDARDLISRLAVLSVPSRTEGTPLVVLEGMEAGTPVVASRVGGVANQITTGVDGTLVRFDDEHAHAQAWLDLLRYPRRAKIMAERAREGGPHRAYASMVDRVEALYRSASESTCDDTGACRSPHSPLPIP